MANCDNIIDQYIDECNINGDIEKLVMCSILKKAKGGSYVADCLFDDDKSTWVVIPRVLQNVGFMKYQFYMNSTLNKEELKLFLSSNIFNKQMPYIIFGAITDTVKHAVEELSQSFGFRLIENNEEKTNVFYLEKSNYAFNNSVSELPSKYQLRSLLTTDAVHLAEQWHYTSDIYPGYSREEITSQLEHIISVNDGVGITCRGEENGRSTNNLVGAVVEDYHGAIGRLYVLPEHQGRGLGNILVRELIRKLLITNEIVFTFITLNNTQSRRLFNKLGFQMCPTLRGWYRCLK